MDKPSFKIKCPNCRNAVIENAREGEGKFVTRYKQLQRLNGHIRVQCRGCGAWIQIPRDLI